MNMNIAIPGKARRQDVLAQLIFEYGWKIGAEIGVLHGQTYIDLLKRFPDLTLIGVDVWEGIAGPPVGDKMTGDVCYDADAMRRHEKTVREAARPFGSRALLMKAKSVEAAKSVVDGSLDFAFIDADHHTDAVLADIAAWKPKLVRGGYLLGHDLNWQSVRAAIDRALPWWEELPANIWAWHERT